MLLKKKTVYLGFIFIRIKIDKSKINSNYCRDALGCKYSLNCRRIGYGHNSLFTACSKNLYSIWLYNNNFSYIPDQAIKYQYAS